jgi:hypothetical protein
MHVLRRLIKNSNKYNMSRGMLGLMVGVLLAGGCVSIGPKPPDITAPAEHGTLEAVWKNLEKMGYTRNNDLSTRIKPGTIIQTTSRGKDNQPIKEITATVFLEGGECLPGVAYSESSMPDTIYGGTKSNATVLDVQLIHKILPNLKVDSSMVDNYSLQLSGMKSLVIPRAKMLNMAEVCNASLEKTLKRGDKLEWFEFVNEVVAAESIELDITWTGQGIINADYKKSLAQALGGPSAKFVSTSSDGRAASLYSEQRIFLAYKARAIEAIR